MEKAIHMPSWSSGDDDFATIVENGSTISKKAPVFKGVVK
jgi:hypothetical protein